MQTASAALARFIARSRWDDVPQAIRHEARRALLDWLGCAIAGRAEPATLKLLKAVDPKDPLSAALVHGFAANILDFDDTHLPTVIHPSTPVAAALFALAAQRKVSGKDLLLAFVVGIEAECRLGNAVTPGHYEHGWHITGTCGVFGAAAACCRILGLSEAQVRSALGIAATQASGLVEMMGSEAKSLNGALAARNGLFAALLAATGFEGPEEPIEGAHGFIIVLGGSRDLSRITRVPDSEWALAQVAYKPYPCGVVLHGLIDACLEARPQISVADVREIDVTLHPLAIERADRPEPRTGLEAKLSAQHAAAVTLAQGQAGIAQFRDETVADPQLARLRQKVRIEPDPRLTKAGAIVRIDGVRIEVLHARGTPERPMSDAELQAKFRALAGPRAQEWIGFVDSLEAVDKVSLPD